jgi:hypothetical protein
MIFVDEMMDERSRTGPAKEEYMVGSDVRLLRVYIIMSGK